MKSFSEIIRDEFRNALSLIAILVGALVAGYSYNNLRESVAQEKALILNFASTVTEADRAADDVLSISKDLGRFVETLSHSKFPEARIEVWLDGRLIANAGPQRSFGFLSESFESQVSLKSGESALIKIQISEFNYLLWSMLSLLFLEALMFLGIGWMRRRLERSTLKLTAPLSKTVESIRKIATNLANGVESRLPKTADNLEIASLNDSVNLLLSQIANLKHDIAKINFDRGRLKVVDIVSHNVMGPVGTLDMIAKTYSNLSSSERSSLVHAIGRIRDTVKSLEVGKVEDVTLRESQNKASLVHLPTVLDQIVAEKRLTYRDRTGVSIETEGLQGYDLFIHANKPDLEAIISNLIDNSVEALPETGRVSVLVRLKLKGDQLVFEVKDNGKGIPAHILPKLFEKGFTFGKANGKGVGLYHARETLKQWNSKIEIDSEVRVGTTVAVTIPKSKAPSWLLPELSIMPKTEVIIIDDDPLIHEAWDLRLSKLGPITITHFLSPAEFKQSMVGRDLRFERRLYLMDQEFSGFEENGLDLIKMFGIEVESYLVTGRHSDPGIVNRVQEMGVRQIPKAFMSVVPISLCKDTLSSMNRDVVEL